MSNMRPVPHDYTHLWNELPMEDRLRLMPHQMEAQILHLEQARNLAVMAHKRYLREMDQWINNIKQDLGRQG